MDSALKLFPYNLVNHSLPVHSSFSLECLRNNIYAEAKKRDKTNFRITTEEKYRDRLSINLSKQSKKRCL
jgi:aminopeptidase-like protein